MTEQREGKGVLPLPQDHSAGDGGRGGGPALSGPMPAIFVAHGAPTLLDMPSWVRELNDWAKSMPRPRSVLVLSAHWEAHPISLGATRTVPLVYDFYGFPERFYGLKYPAPGAPDLARRVRALLSPKRSVVDEPSRGLDHGAYIPLIAMYPEADIPVLQVSLPSLDPKDLFALGQSLAPLRGEGTLVVGSGFITHNLHRADFGPDPRTPAWASEFDQWTAEALGRNDIDGLLDFERRGPGVRMSLPTTEHFAPLLTALGTGSEGGSLGVRFPITGFLAGSLTRRSVQFG